MSIVFKGEEYRARRCCEFSVATLQDMLGLLYRSRVAVPRVPLSARTFGNSAYRALPHRKDHLNSAEQKEQKAFDDNQARLEKMEHSDSQGVDRAHRKSDAELRKTGEDAQIEQGRADDGVY